MLIDLNEQEVLGLIERVTASAPSPKATKGESAPPAADPLAPLLTRLLSLKDLYQAERALYKARDQMNRQSGKLRRVGEPHKRPGHLLDIVPTAVQLPPSASPTEDP